LPQIYWILCRLIVPDPSATVLNIADLNEAADAALAAVAAAEQFGGWYK
jgi:hypothetical protein